MKNINLPFQIGENYENWEFDLEVLDVERIKGYDGYIYIREIVFLGAIPRYVELIFSWDILEVVIMTFEFNSLEQLHQFIQILRRKFEEITQHKNEFLNTKNYYSSEDLGLMFVYSSFSNTFEIAYGKGKYLEQVYKKNGA